MEVFNKKASPTDVKKRLAIPTHCLKHLPGFNGKHFFYLKVKDANHKPWKFKCSKRKKGDHPKPVFSQGWLHFARSVKLKIGDNIALFLDDDHHYRIEVQRKINLFGNHVSARVI